jgi:SAM-dependent methyltransferase
MLRDRVRCEAYRQALLSAVRPGDVVLDMGAGTGLLSLFALQAGARRVYAVERTSIAAFARQLVEQNGAADRIEIIQDDVENVQLPEPVDVLVSEWMGGCGVDENLLAPLLASRDRWLKPGGIMLPERVTAWMAPVWDRELDAEMSFFLGQPYGLDLGLVAEGTAQELFIARYHVSEQDLRAEPQPMWSTDAYTCSVEEASSPFRASMQFLVTRAGPFNSLAAWFRAECGAGIVLTNAPDAPATHWGRWVLPLERGLSVERGAAIWVDLICEPDEPGWCDHRWSVRVGDGNWEDHNSRWAIG